jgi:hypothetical protein
MCSPIPWLGAPRLVGHTPTPAFHEKLSHAHAIVSRYPSGPAAVRLLTILASPNRRGQIVRAPQLTTTDNTSASITQMTDGPYRAVNAVTAARAANMTQEFLPVTVS